MGWYVQKTGKLRIFNDIYPQRWGRMIHKMDNSRF